MVEYLINQPPGGGYRKVTRYANGTYLVSGETEYDIPTDARVVGTLEIFEGAGYCPIQNIVYDEEVVDFFKK